MFVECGSNLLADELLTLDIEQSPHVRYVIRKEFEGVFVYWVNLSGIMTILKVGKLKGQRVRLGEIATIRHHLDGVNGRTWIFEWTSNALRKGDEEFVQKLGAFLLGHIIDIIITIGTHLSERLVWCEFLVLDVRAIVTQRQKYDLTFLGCGVINPCRNDLEFYGVRILVHDERCKTIDGLHKPIRSAIRQIEVSSMSFNDIANHAQNKVAIYILYVCHALLNARLIGFSSCQIGLHLRCVIGDSIYISPLGVLSKELAMIFNELRARMILLHFVVTLCKHKVLTLAILTTSSIFHANGVIIQNTGECHFSTVRDGFVGSLIGHMLAYVIYIKLAVHEVL